jgi:rod shape-determining protein MreD
VVLLLLAHVFLRPRLTVTPYAPDFVLIALVLYAARSRPGAGAVAGFVAGLLTDAVAPTTFGAGAFALTVVGFGTGWIRSLVFADNVLVTGVLVFAASWLRDALELVASSTLRAAPGLQLFIISPLAALTTAGTAIVVLLLFRGWLRAAPAL